MGLLRLGLELAAAPPGTGTLGRPGERGPVLAGVEAKVDAPPGASSSPGEGSRPGTATAGDGAMPI